MAFLPEFRGQPAGTWASKPAGILLHGSRGGNPNRQAEFLGTAHWCHNNSDGLSWHVTVGDGAYIQHLTMQEWGWHAREASKIYIGVEFAQPTVNDAITDAQVGAFSKWYKDVVAISWPHLVGPKLVLPAHSETVPGVKDGKSDPFPKGDARNDELRARLYAAIADQPSGRDAAWDAYRAAHPDRGEPIQAGHLVRVFPGLPGGEVYDGDALICTGGVLGWRDNAVLDLTSRVMDDWSKQQKTAGTFVPY